MKNLSSEIKAITKPKVSFQYLCPNQSKKMETEIDLGMLKVGIGGIWITFIACPCGECHKVQVYPSQA